MTQRIAYYYANIEQGGNRYTTQSYALHTRRELTQFINQTINAAQFSQRSRRQISIPFIWRWIQLYGSQFKGSFEIEQTIAGYDGKIKFVGMTESQFMAAYL